MAANPTPFDDSIRKHEQSILDVLGTPTPKDKLQVAMREAALDALFVAHAQLLRDRHDFLAKQPRAEEEEDEDDLVHVTLSEEDEKALKKADDDLQATLALDASGGLFEDAEEVALIEGEDLEESVHLVTPAELEQAPVEQAPAQVEPAGDAASAATSAAAPVAAAVIVAADEPSENEVNVMRLLLRPGSHSNTPSRTTSHVSPLDAPPARTLSQLQEDPEKDEDGDAMSHSVFEIGFIAPEHKPSAAADIVVIKEVEEKEPIAPVPNIPGGAPAPSVPKPHRLIQTKVQIPARSVEYVFGPGLALISKLMETTHTKISLPPTKLRMMGNCVITVSGLRPVYVQDAVNRISTASRIFIDNEKRQIQLVQRKIETPPKDKVVGHPNTPNAIGPVGVGPNSPNPNHGVGPKKFMMDPITYKIMGTVERHSDPTKRYLAADKTFVPPPSAPPCVQQANTTHIFVDLSNILIGAGKGRTVNMYDIITTIESGRVCGTRRATGSNASARVVAECLRAGCTVRNVYRAEGAGEVLVDDAIHACMLQAMMDSQGKQTLVLASGDGNDNGGNGNTSFVKVVTTCLNKGYFVEVWSWKASLSYKYKELRFAYPKGRMTIKFLDQFFPLVNAPVN